MTIFWFAAAGFYGALQSIRLSPSLTDFLQRILLVLVILSVTTVLAKILVGFVNLYSRKVGGGLLSTSMFPNITRILVFVIGILIILQSLGISIAPILTALGVGGLAVALALQETLSNLFAGIQVIASKQIKPGDYVQIGSGEEGYVTDITWRYTTIRVLANNIIIIPNAKLASAIVTNYYCPVKEMAVLVQVGVSYDSDLEKVERVTIEVAREVMKDVQGGVPEFEPFIRYHTFNDFSIDFSVILRGREFVDQYLIKHEFVKRLHRRYNAEGIEIPFPIRTIHMQGKV
jgi:small-conductance mechanosensitive channel